MKNFSLILNVVLGASLLFLLTRHKDKTDNTPQPPAQQQQQSENCNSVCMDYTSDPDYTIIEGIKAREMAAAYRNTQGLIPNDANSVWFELDALKKFIWNIEKSICDQKCNAADLKLGVRIYYARYPQTGNQMPPFGDLPVEYTNKHTVFMVPTFEARPDSNQDFYMNKPFANCSPVAIPADGHIDPVGLFTPLGKNHGTLCPPVCGGASFSK